ncbi:MAG TPA: 50S ribosome-binding GTPase, partial [Burkholderiaceae bacterium]|nr:50S ribosome-binding GTPase [Burkholderiaceae bacterium]
SLLNALAGAELAIVTPIPGTTRDKVSETLQIEGVPVHVIDTAGLREDAEASDEVERIGIGRSWQAIAEADAVLLLHDLTRIDEPAYAAADAAIAARLPAGAQLVHVYNKADAVPAERLAQLEGIGPPDGGEPLRIALSARTHAGLDALRRQLLQLAGWHAAPEGVFLARERHVQALRAAQAHLAEAQAWAGQADAALDLLAEELRLAHDALGEITGACTPDDLLGVIFSRFCIGK